MEPSTSFRGREPRVSASLFLKIYFCGHQHARRRPTLGRDLFRSLQPLRVLQRRGGAGYYYRTEHSLFVTLVLQLADLQEISFHFGG